MDIETRPAVATTCPYCGVGCGVLARRDADNTVSIAGDPNHPANFGRLCSKGAALGETVSLEDRLLHPTMNGARVTWDTALSKVAGAFAKSIEEYGPDSVAFYVSGQLLTEDYYVANKLIKGFIGTANIDTNSRLCMASSVAGHKRAFGADTVPGVYEDLEVADLVILVGSNLAWCHPVLFQRLMAAKVLRPAMRIVVVDPRATATTAGADLHLALKPDTDVALFAGLLHHLCEAGRANGAFVADHTSGAEDALAEAAKWDIRRVAEATGLTPSDLQLFYDWVAASQKTVTAYSQGVNQSAMGTDKVNAIINTHLLTGRIGMPGMGPFSLTGQPNAMGGREVGGLSNMLACHMELGDADARALVQRHWNSPRMADKPGLKAVELFDAALSGQIKALWVMATNPAASLPQAHKVDEALSKVPFLVVSDVVRSNDTLRHADVALPAAAWGEKDGTVTNSERRISRQRPFLPLPGEARPDWAIICDVAERMGFFGFDYNGPSEVFEEHARLSAARNEGRRDFDLSGLTDLSTENYDRLAPLQWPIRRGQPPKARFFADGRFYTPDQRARFVATPFTVPDHQAPRFPFVLNTGRVRDQWHTMTRTGRSPTLAAHLGEPYVELHPGDADDLGIGAAELVEVASPDATILVRALVSDRQQSGSVFVPIHWTDENSANARVDKLIAPRVDPISGQPASKSARVALRRFPARTYGFAVSALPFETPPFDYWVKSTTAAGAALEFAGREALDDPLGAAKAMLGRDDLYAAVDKANGSARFAAYDQGKLVGAAYFAREPVAASRAFVAAALGTDAPSDTILAGRPPAGRLDPGPIVCACFQVGANAIRAAIDGGAATVDAIGEQLGAGTNCGSCRGEISQLIARSQSAPDAVAEECPTLKKAADCEEEDVHAIA